jgi:hypothetical protein
MDSLVAIECSSEAVRVDVSVTLKAGLGVMKISTDNLLILQIYF